MIAPLATSWTVILETDCEEPEQTTLEAFGPFSGDRAREQAQTFADSQTHREDVYSVAVLPMRSPER